MWVEIICGFIIYRLFKSFFYDHDILDGETSTSSSHSQALFSVADRLGKLYGGKVYVGIRIPDADGGCRRTIDMVLLTKGELCVISVKNISGFLSINSDGSWVCEGEGKHKAEHFPDPVAETRKQASVLESYLEQRGIGLPEGYISCKVILPNPKLRTFHTTFPPEVITSDQWVSLKPEAKSLFPSWMKSTFCGGKKEMQESLHQKLEFVLSTAPIWDRLELKGCKHVLGNFLEFKGKQDDMQALRNIKRSKVAHIVIQKTSMFGLAPLRLQVLCCLRDYRTEGAATEWKEVTVRSSTEIIFQPENGSKVCKFKLSSVVSLTLSA